LFWAYISHPFKLLVLCIFGCLIGKKFKYSHAFFSHQLYNTHCTTPINNERIHYFYSIYIYIHISIKRNVFFFTLTGSSFIPVKSFDWSLYFTLPTPYIIIHDILYYFIYIYIYIYIYLKPSYNILKRIKRRWKSYYYRIIIPYI
jgi:hypothetical protein